MHKVGSSQHVISFFILHFTHKLVYQVPPAPTQLHMLPLADLKYNPIAFIQLPKSYPVPQVERLHSHRNYLGLLLHQYTLGICVCAQNMAFSRPFGSKPSAFLWYNCFVLGKQDKDQLIERGQILCISVVPRKSNLIVDRHEKIVGCEIRFKFVGVSKVLCLQRNIMKRSILGQQGADLNKV